MFGIVRSVFWLLLLLVVAVWIFTSKVRRKKQAIIGAIVLVLLGGTASFFVPIENAFVTFESPGAAYQYTNINGYEVQLVLEGTDSAMVVGGKQNTTNNLIIPKKDGGWGVGLSIHSEEIYKDFVGKGKGILEICRLRESDDYYLIAFGIPGNNTVSDSQGSKFVSLPNSGAENNTYYALIEEPNAQYEVFIAGESIRPLDCER